MEVMKVDDISLAAVVKEFYHPGIPVIYKYAWHTAYAVTPSISEAFNHLDKADYKDFVRDAWSFKIKEISLKADTKTGYALLAR